MNESHCTLSAPAEPALRARDAGEYLAKLVGIAMAFPPRKMWSLARAEAIPFVRVNRDLWFRPADLRSFVENGGTGARHQRLLSSLTASCPHTS